MKKLNSLTNPLTGLDGQPIGEETVGKMMANVLARAQSADSVRAMMIAMEIHGQKSVDLEDADFALVQEADFALVQEAVDKDQMLTNLGKAALLTALTGAKTKE